MRGSKVKALRKIFVKRSEELGRVPNKRAWMRYKKNVRDAHA